MEALRYLERSRAKYVYGHSEALDQALDAAFAAAARAAAAVVRTAESGWPLERELEEALVGPLEQGLAQAVDGCTVRARVKLDTLSWSPQPGHIDVVVFRHDEAWAAAELKIASVEQSLWDIFKLLTVEPELRACYLIVAASTRKWQSDTAYVALFAAGAAARWEARAL